INVAAYKISSKPGQRIELVVSPISIQSIVFPPHIRGLLGHRGVPLSGVTTLLERPEGGRRSAAFSAIVEREYVSVTSSCR
ncbi:MAG: hypothetical protein WCB75_19680, partial [Pseudolabrys sp.]